MVKLLEKLFNKNTQRQGMKKIEIENNKNDFYEYAKRFKEYMGKLDEDSKNEIKKSIFNSDYIYFNILSDDENEKNKGYYYLKDLFKIGIIDDLDLNKLLEDEIINSDDLKKYIFNDENNKKVTGKSNRERKKLVYKADRTLNFLLKTSNLALTLLKNKNIIDKNCN